MGAEELNMDGQTVSVWRACNPLIKASGEWEVGERSGF